MAKPVSPVPGLTKTGSPFQAASEAQSAVICDRKSLAAAPVSGYSGDSWSDYIVRQPKTEFVEERGLQGRRERDRKGLRFALEVAAETRSVERPCILILTSGAVLFIGIRPAEPVLLAQVVIDLNADRLPVAIHAGPIYRVLAFCCSSPEKRRLVQAVAIIKVVSLGHNCVEVSDIAARIVCSSKRIPGSAANHRTAVLVLLVESVIGTVYRV